MLDRQQLIDDLELYRRWKQYLLWRGLLIFVVGPFVLAVLWLIAISQGLINEPADPVLAYQCLVAISLAFGLVFWSKSPLDLRARLRKVLTRFLSPQ